MAATRRYTLTEADKSFFTTNYRRALNDKGELGFSHNKFGVIFPNSPVLNLQRFNDRGEFLDTGTNPRGAPIKYNDDTVQSAFKNVLKKININSPDFLSPETADLNFADTPSFDINEPINVNEFSKTGGFDSPLHGSPNLSVPDINNLPDYSVETSDRDDIRLTKSTYYYKNGDIDLEKSGGYGNKTFSNSTNRSDSENSRLGDYMSHRSSLKKDLGKSWIIDGKNSNTTFTNSSNS